MHRFFLKQYFVVLAPFAAVGANIEESQTSLLKDKILRNHVAYDFPSYRCSLVSIGSNAVNQDNFVASNSVVGVLDGHGDRGHEVSTFLSHRLRHLRPGEDLAQSIFDCEVDLRHEFADLDIKRYPSLLSHSKFARRSILKAHAGSTVCVASPEGKPNWWTFANLGDSQAVFVDLPSSTVNSLTSPENITDSKEQERLFQAHPNEKHNKLYQKEAYVLGRVQPTSGIGDFHVKEPLDVIQRLFDPVVGKSNTHTSGYYLTPPYLRHVPTLTHWKLDLNAHSFIVIATDGFWDRVTPEQVKTALCEWKEKNKVDSPAIHLAELALTTPCKTKNQHSTTMDWNIVRSCFSKNVRDDMTILVVTK